MSPTQEQIRIPSSLELTQRPRHAPRAERPIVRDREGRVFAVVEQWVPQLVN